MGLGLKFLVNYHYKRFGQSQKKREKISGLISLFMKATIPGTHGSTSLFHFIFLFKKIFFPLLCILSHSPVTYTLEMYTVDIWPFKTKSLNLGLVARINFAYILCIVSKGNFTLQSNSVITNSQGPTESVRYNCEIL